MSVAGYVEPTVGHATHYHTKWVVPFWSSSLSKLGTIGAHIFYRWKGRNGSRQAFTSNYSVSEALPDSLATNLKGFLLTDAANGGLGDLLSSNALAIPSTNMPGTDPITQLGSNNEMLLRSSDQLIDGSSKKNMLVVDEKAPALNEKKATLVMDNK